MNQGYRLDRPFTLTCPECGGALTPEHESGLRRYRCHIGHVLTAEVMLVAQFVELENSLGVCIRKLNERSELCRQVAKGSPEGSEHERMLLAACEQAQTRAKTIIAVLEEEWLHPLSALPDSAPAPERF